MQAPSSAAASAPTRYCPLMAASSRKKVAAMAPTPPASPSMLSSRLSELVMNTTQNTVAAPFSSGWRSTLICTPERSRIRAAAIWPSSFAHAGNDRRSSQRPRKETSVAPRNIPTTWLT